MEYIKGFDIDMLGTESGLQRRGKFKVKTMLSRRDRFAADENRRRLIGGFNPSEALITLQQDAFVLGQLQARIVEAPDWWIKAQNGEDLPDGNVISKIYEEALRLEEERKAALQTAATAAHREMTKEDEKQ